MSKSVTAKMNKWIVPALVVLVFGGWLASKVRMPAPEFGEMKVQQFGELPVLFQGRVKPWDTLARNSLTIVSDKQTWLDTPFVYVPDLRNPDAADARAPRPAATVSELLVEPGDAVAAGTPVARLTVTEGEGESAKTRTVDAVASETGEIITLDVAVGDTVETSDVVATLEGETRQAIDWLLETMTLSSTSYRARVFRIQNPQVLNLLGLPERTEPAAHRFRYAFAEFGDKLRLLDEHERQARQREAGQRDVLDNQVMDLANRIRTFIQLQEAHRIVLIRSEPQAEMIARRYHQIALLRDQQQQMAFIRQYQNLSQFPLPHAILPASGDAEWKPFTQASLESAIGQPDAAYMTLMTLCLAYADGEAKTFNEQLAAYADIVEQRMPHVETTEARLGFEAFFNHFEPFYHTSVLYVVAFLLSIFALLGWTGTLNRSAYVLLLVAAVVHTLAIAARVYISGYPPITNLYGTAIFIGWGAVILCLMLEPIYKLGVGLIVASVAGFVTLVIAHMLAGDGDTLEMMQAVLDTKFWLATHVVIINLGYMGAIVAGLMAALYILQANRWAVAALGVFCIAFSGVSLQMYFAGSPAALWYGLGALVVGLVLCTLGGLILSGVTALNFDADTEKQMGRMIYGVICFALLMSFVGTVLGGLWADDSWGRFWGWDPKENGALMIVLWNALILHARWGGMIKQRGIAVLAIFGNVVTAWSWFGVNQLGVGLHSYGFMDSAVFWLFTFVISQLVLMGAGMMPRSMWHSDHQPRDATMITDAATA